MLSPAVVATGVADLALSIFPRVFAEAQEAPWLKMKELLRAGVKLPVS